MIYHHVILASKHWSHVTQTNQKFQIPLAPHSNNGAENKQLCWVLSLRLCVFIGPLI